MISEHAIHVENLGKMYNLYSSPQDRLKHTFFWRFGKSYGRSFWALKDVSFSIQPGETFGIIGKNGSGKSTLLQILAGIIAPTEGQVHVNGRVAALLELGSGFNPEFTGRENVYLNGSILGISRAEMEERIDAIIAFADIGDFIDQPVKLYSSGMFVRLAFSVATSVDAEILLIDEALAVGDIFFRQKCYQKLERLREQGASVVLVSHSMNEVEQFCQRALLLNEGQPLFLGPAVEAVKRFYFVDQYGREMPTAQPSKATGARSEEHSNGIDDGMQWPLPGAFFGMHDHPQATQGLANCTRIAVCNDQGNPCGVFQQGETARFYFEFQVHEDIEVPSGGIEILNDKGIIIHGKNSMLLDTNVVSTIPKGSLVRFRQDMKLNIAVGEYSYNAGLATIQSADYQQRSRLTNEELNAKSIVLCIVPNAGKFSVIYRKGGQPAQLTHFGLADLPGDILFSYLPPQE